MKDEQERSTKVIVNAVMSIYFRVKMTIRVDLMYVKNFRAIWCNQQSVLSSLLFAIAAYVLMKKAREGLINEISHKDDYFNKSTENLREKFLKWKEMFESNELKVTVSKTKVMVNGLKGEILKNKVYPYAKCGKRVMANSVMCTK